MRKCGVEVNDQGAASYHIDLAAPRRIWFLKSLPRVWAWCSRYMAKSDIERVLYSGSFAGRLT